MFDESIDRKQQTKSSMLTELGRNNNERIVFLSLKAHANPVLSGCFFFLSLSLSIISNVSII